MTRTVIALCAAGCVAGAIASNEVSVRLNAEPAAPGLVAADGGGSDSASDARAVLDSYCVSCHNQRVKTAGLMLDAEYVAEVGRSAEVWEKVVRKLRAGTMPPVGRPRPEKPAAAA